MTIQTFIRIECTMAARQSRLGSKERVSALAIRIMSNIYK